MGSWGEGVAVQLETDCNTGKCIKIQKLDQVESRYIGNMDFLNKKLQTLNTGQI